ncbi:hypothetical protein BP5796_10707 [Coleophoma crateriformis]|uniref:Uncharacterized protein n=1 Tax=Coleophoma crateriformis TaxID=565419 RepID=A0A3D8QQY7_9HELO|nr:hypothetical protein BP5796_10707 [Coleophoma crateriformis]
MTTSALLPAGDPVLFELRAEESTVPARDLAYLKVGIHWVRDINKKVFVRQSEILQIPQPLSNLTAIAAMCLFRPRLENDFEFVDRRPARKVYIAAVTPSPRRSVTRTRISDTVIVAQPPAAQYVQAPARTSVPKIVKAPTPPPPAPTPAPARVELVEVEEAHSPRASRTSVSRRSSRRKSRGGEEREVYIERERERIRGLGRQSPQHPPMEQYRYVEGVQKETRFLEESPYRARSRSITYETNPRHSGRIHERERVVIEDDGRRREFYQRR